MVLSKKHATFRIALSRIPLSGIALSRIAPSILSFFLSFSVCADGDILYLWNRNFDTAPVNKVVELALSKTEDLYAPVTIMKSSAMEQGAAVQALLRADEGLDLLSMASSENHDDLFLTVRFPALKGLLGNRVCLIRKGGQAQFSRVETAHDFIDQGIKVCQGEQWPDTLVLKRNGFPIVAARQYRELFSLLEKGQCDCFLRGVQEIVPEWKNNKARFDIENRILIQYPQPGFIYIPKTNPVLATRIELGLLRAFDDGSYQAMFDHVMGPHLKQLNMKSRITIPINNPYVSKINKSVQKIKELWFAL